MRTCQYSHNRIHMRQVQFEVKMQSKQDEKETRVHTFAYC